MEPSDYGVISIVLLLSAACLAMKYFSLKYWHGWQKSRGEVVKLLQSIAAVEVERDVAERGVEEISHLVRNLERANHKLANQVAVVGEDFKEAERDAKKLAERRDKWRRRAEEADQKVETKNEEIKAMVEEAVRLRESLRNSDEQRDEFEVKAARAKQELGDLKKQRHVPTSDGEKKLRTRLAEFNARLEEAEKASSDTITRLKIDVKKKDGEIERLNQVISEYAESPTRRQLEQAWNKVALLESELHELKNDEKETEDSKAE